MYSDRKYVGSPFPELMLCMEYYRRVFARAVCGYSTRSFAPGGQTKAHSTEYLMQAISESDSLLSEVWARVSKVFESGINIDLKGFEDHQGTLIEILLCSEKSAYIVDFDRVLESWRAQQEAKP